MRHPSRLAVAALTALILGTAARASDLCPDEQATEQVPPKDPADCANLDDAMRHPAPSAGPVRTDARRLHQPLLPSPPRRRLGDGQDRARRRPLRRHPRRRRLDRQRPGHAHACPDLVLAGNGGLAGKIPRSRQHGADPPPVPTARSWSRRCTTPPPPSACRVPDLLKLKPVEQGAAVMVRDSKAAKDGWFWGWYGWPEGKRWHVDYPPVAIQPAAVHGLWPVLRQLPRLRQRQPDIRQPRQHQGSARHLPRLFEPGLSTKPKVRHPGPGQRPRNAVPSEHLKILALGQPPYFDDALASSYQQHQLSRRPEPPPVPADQPRSGGNALKDAVADL